MTVNPVRRGIQWVDLFQRPTKRFDANSIPRETGLELQRVLREELADIADKVACVKHVVNTGLAPGRAVRYAGLSRVDIWQTITSRRTPTQELKASGCVIEAAFASVFRE